MFIIDCIQGSSEWLKARSGVPTASNFNKIVTTKGERSKQREKYMYKLAGEFVSGQIEETYSNSIMDRGLEMESEAKDFYFLTQNRQPLNVGFCLDENNFSGASPDALIGNDGLLEIKCPLMSTHVGYLLEKKLPSDYFQQVHGQLFVTGREWCDFLSYYPGLKPLLIRVERDEKFIDKLKAELITFKEDLKKIITEISR